MPHRWTTFDPADPRGMRPRFSLETSRRRTLLAVAAVTLFEPLDLAHLVRLGRNSAILSFASQRLLDRAYTLGRFRARLSFGESCDARDLRLPGDVDHETPRAAWSMARGIDFRVAPGVR